jgi:hypothetical protein
MPSVGQVGGGAPPSDGRRLRIRPRTSPKAAAGDTAAGDTATGDPEDDEPAAGEPAVGEPAGHSSSTAAGGRRDGGVTELSWRIPRPAGGGGEDGDGGQGRRSSSGGEG